MGLRARGSLLVLGLFLLGLCGAAATDRLRVVSTTTIVGDVIRRIGGENIDLHVILPVGADPHGYTLTPQDLVAVSDADLTFMNGAGLEAGWENLLSYARGRVISLSDGLPLVELDGETDHGVNDDEHEEEGTSDPHVWFDPTLVQTWSWKIREALSEIDPGHGDDYAAREAELAADLAALDGWIVARVEEIPVERRVLVTDHLAFGYFARRYGFRQIGAVIPGFSTLAEPSAREMAALIDAVRAADAPAVFVGTTANPTLSATVAGETGTRLVALFTGSLSGPGEGAETYLEMMRTNVERIAAALTE
ncbi:MAG: metal ABC transporter substrate-binding protein [Candidatus Bipolaricaulota bacterium]